MEMKKYAVIVAGGSGTRMGHQLPKQFLQIHGRPLIWYTLTAFLDAYPDLEIILVLPAAHVRTGAAILKDFDLEARVRILVGGETRFHSVRAGLALVTSPSIVFVHDGVRCLLTKALIQRCYETAVEFGSAIPCIGSRDSLRLITENESHALDRDTIKLVQTPQTFHSDWLLPAYASARGSSFTDDAAVVEAMDHQLHLVEGETDNIKITTPMDLVVAEHLLNRP